MYLLVNIISNDVQRTFRARKIGVRNDATARSIPRAALDAGIAGDVFAGFPGSHSARSEK